MSWDTVISTLKEMMTDRGYPYWEVMDGDLYIASGDKKPSLLIYCCHNDKFNIESVKYMVIQLQQRQMHHGITVYQNIITSSARKAIEHLHDYTIELFDKSELQYNLTQHRLYCPHVRIPKDQIPVADISHLPILLRTDAVSRYFHFTRGEVVRIIRKNDSVAYRIVK